MPDYRIPKRIFYGKLKSGQRSRGGQMRRFKDDLKATQKSSGVNLETWKADAQDRTRWREICHSGVATFKAEWLVKLEDKRNQTKDRTHDSAQLATATSTCTDCGRVYKYGINLYSHQITHSKDWLGLAGAHPSLDGRLHHMRADHRAKALPMLNKLHWLRYWLQGRCTEILYVLPWSQHICHRWSRSLRHVLHSANVCLLQTPHVKMVIELRSGLRLRRSGVACQNELRMTYLLLKIRRQLKIFYFRLFRQHWLIGELKYSSDSFYAFCNILMTMCIL